MKKKWFWLVVVIVASISGIFATGHAKKAKVIQDAYFEKSPVITPFADKYWLLLEDLNLHITKTDGEKVCVTVPAGFVCDLASIPKGLNVIFDKYGRYAAAGIVHDYLYWMQPCPRKVADKMIKLALVVSGSSKKTGSCMKVGVNIGGKIAWNRNQRRREKGDVRFVPAGFRDFRANTKWKTYAQYLAEKGQSRQMKDLEKDSFSDIFIIKTDSVTYGD